MNLIFKQQNIDVMSASIGSDMMDNYSTEEVQIGTWIDGKPLYRKVVTKQNISLKSGTATEVLEMAEMKDITMIDMHGYIKFQLNLAVTTNGYDSWYPIPYYVPNSVVQFFPLYYSSTYATASLNSKLKLQYTLGSQAVYTGATMIAIICHYTKDAD